MQTRDNRGFTLIELIVVLAIMALLAGTVVPLVSATQEAERITRVEEELQEIAEALDEHYFEYGTFPASLTEAGFYGRHILPGVQDAHIKDEWGSRTYYQISATTNPDVITVYSVGENGTDDGVSSEQFKTTVMGSGPGDRRTRLRMNVIAGALALYLGTSGGGGGGGGGDDEVDDGGDGGFDTNRAGPGGIGGFALDTATAEPRVRPSSLTGNWSTDRVTLGLGSEYQTDGYGTDFSLDPSTYVLRSAGADRTMNTADDLTL